MNVKGWNLSASGASRIPHAFTEEGTAVCRKTIRHSPIAPLLTLAEVTTPDGIFDTPCQNCRKKLESKVDDMPQTDDAQTPEGAVSSPSEPADERAEYTATLDRLFPRKAAAVRVRPFYARVFEDEQRHILSPGDTRTTLCGLSSTQRDVYLDGSEIRRPDPDQLLNLRPHLVCERRAEERGLTPSDAGTDTDALPPIMEPYTVTWSLPKVDATSPEEAARAALAIIRRNWETWSLQFAVEGPDGDVTAVDLNIHGS
ncbi:hypothetical protein [Streptomyces sp. NPDC020141]|uniref:hypothetical protein n=1 Tax=Streptomyces sp. NPDC020141 TaxID=3365065 RepID=UPI0037AAF8A1